MNLSVLGEPKKTTNQFQLRYNCPFHHDEDYHLGVNLKKKMYHCFKCDASGRIDDIVSQTDGFEDMVRNRLKPKKRSEEIFQKVKISIPDHSKPITDQSGLPYRYLRNRWIYHSDIIKYNFHYCTDGMFKDRIIVPIYEKGKLVYFLARAYLKVEPKYLNCPSPKDKIIFKTFDSTVQEAVICEGVFDAITVGKVSPAIAMLGKKSSPSQISKIVKSITGRAIIMLDQDAKKEAMDLWGKLNLYLKCKVVFINEKDPGGMDPERIRNLI